MGGGTKYTNTAILSDDFFPLRTESKFPYFPGFLNYTGGFQEHGAQADVIGLPRQKLYVFNLLSRAQDGNPVMDRVMLTLHVK